MAAFFFFEKTFLRNELAVIYAQDNEHLFQSKDIQTILRNIVENDLSETLPNVYKLFNLIGTIPATTVSVERSFSCLNRIKTYLRSTMSQDRLSNLSLISIEKELLFELSQSSSWHENIINKFAQGKERRIDLLYK